MKEIPVGLLEGLARSYGTAASGLTYFQGGHPWSDGVLYEYSAMGGTYILKIIEMPEAEVADRLQTMKGRLEFVRFLGERGVPIVYPEPTVHGGLYAVEQSPDQTVVAYTYRKREGLPLFKHPWDEHEELFALWGRTMGSMHAAAAEYPVWQMLPGDLEGRLLGWEMEWRFFDSFCKDDEVREQWQALKLQLDELPQERDGFGFTHNDLHMENLLFRQGEITVLDFDVASPHWFACDLAIALYSIFAYAANGMLEKPPANPLWLKKVAARFLEGYESEYPLSPYWRQRINLFLHYRRILLFTIFAPELIGKDPQRHEEWRSRILESAPFPEWEPDAAWTR